MKKTITRILAVICTLFTLGYTYDLYQNYARQEEAWNELARKAFMEAIDIEIEKRSDIPVRITSSENPDSQTLGMPNPTSVKVINQYGERDYKIPTYKFEHSYIKENGKRIMLSILLEEHPIAIDTLRLRWDSLLTMRQIKANTYVRCISTDLLEHNDTLYDSPRKIPSQTDSLLSVYMGYRCEIELTGYISHPWQSILTLKNITVLLFPWACCVFIFLFFERLKQFFRPAPQKIEIEKVIEVEKVIYVANEVKGKIDGYKLEDGTYLNVINRELQGTDGKVTSVSPQVCIMLSLFFKAPAHRISMNEAIKHIWETASETDTAKFHRLLRLTRNALKEVTSFSIIHEGNGIYILTKQKKQ